MVTRLQLALEIHQQRGLLQNLFWAGQKGLCLPSPEAAWFFAVCEYKTVLVYHCCVPLWQSRTSSLPYTIACLDNPHLPLLLLKSTIYPHVP